jgi:hypothetical protein
MIGEEFGLFQWFIVDGDGDTMLDTVATTYPDHQLHLGRLSLTYKEWEDRGPVHVPRRWSVTAEMDHGSLSYDVVAAGPAWDGAPHERGTPLPNFVLELTGQFTPHAGPEQTIRGLGTGETVISERDPHTGRSQRPW